jgi:lysophospholipase L1-like esterase
MKNSLHLLFFALFLVLSCSSSQDAINNPSNNNARTYRILSLGDSYTIGESVCETCRFPIQLKDQLKPSFGSSDIIDLKIIALTGWTTTNLISAIADENLAANYDLVTLLIGVNNQYQNKPFPLYEDEFPILVNDAIRFAKGDKSNVIVLSIPDYAYTPFGQSTSSPQTISDELDQYNNFAQNYCEQNGITFVTITDITRNGLTNPDLVASDGLHPSELAYSQFVERLLPVALEKIQ